MRIQASRKSAFPIVVSVPHAGIVVPPERAELKDLPRETFLRDVDLAVDEIWGPACAELDITLVVAEDHRYALDLNRLVTETDAQTVEGDANPAGTHPKGLFWITTTQLEPLIQKPLARVTADTLVNSIWRPYYARLETELAALQKIHGFAILIDGHSMPSKGTSYHADPSAFRADLVPGDNDGTSCDARVLKAVVEVAQAEGFSCSPNQPYKGRGLTRSFGKPSAGRHALQIEMNRKLYMDETAFETQSEGLTRMQNFARQTLNALARLNLRSA